MKSQGVAVFRKRALERLASPDESAEALSIVRPADWLLPYGYVAGLYEREGSKLYVNRGFGTAGPPVRMGSPPEVTRIVLTSG